MCGISPTFLTSFRVASECRGREDKKRITHCSAASASILSYFLLIRFQNFCSFGTFFSSCCSLDWGKRKCDARREGEMERDRGRSDSVWSWNQRIIIDQNQPKFNSIVKKCGRITKMSWWGEIWKFEKMVLDLTGMRPIHMGREMSCCTCSLIKSTS